MLALVCVAGTNAAAQTRATSADLVGVVYDQSHAVLPGVTVTATNTEVNQARSTVTDGTGRFTIPALSPATYRVTAELSGFATQMQDGVVLHLGTQVELAFTLQLASVEDNTAPHPGYEGMPTRQREKFTK